MTAGKTLPVTVIMPVFNDARFVTTALESLARQSRQPAEFVIVDNGSEDDSVARIEAMALPQLRLVRNAANVGATAARAQARQLATQPYLCHLDADDWLGDDALGLAMDSLAGGADISLFHLVKTDIAGQPVWDASATAMPIDGAHALALSLGRWDIHSPGVYRTALVEAAAAQFEPHGFSDDEMLTRLCFADAGRIVGNPGRYFYRTNAKPYSFAKIVGQTRTNIRSAALGAERLGRAHRAVADMRAVCVRNLAGLSLRSLRGEGAMDEVRALDAELRALRLPWSPRDAGRAAMLGAARLVMKLK